MSFPGSMYAPPGVYTRTNFENPTVGLLRGLKIPVFLATGSETLSQVDLELVRGSSATVDQQVVGEDLDGRAVVSMSDAGEVTLGAFDGEINQVQTRNFPIVKGDGTGTTATNTSAVHVTINDEPVVLLGIDGAKGILTLSVPPKPGDVVRVTYFFNRTDTLFTDDLSDQVTPDAPAIYGTVGEPYVVVQGETDELLLTVDGVDLTITLSPSTTGWSASQVASQINSQAGATSLVASTYSTHDGGVAIKLAASQDIVVGAGSANSVLGLSAGASTARNRTFYTFQRPIVDGSNGGVTTTAVSDVTVLVDGVQVVPESVDGAAGQVVLPFAPAPGSSVVVTYYHNTYQDTYDYLAHNNVSEITLCGYAPGRSDFTDQADFVLGTVNGNSVIMWGTAVTVSSGVHTSGTEYFGDSQIIPTLVDARAYLAPCEAVVDTSVSPAKVSQVEFLLPHVPTTGNGRNSPLGSSLFQSASNNRIDLPTNRPDLVKAYWGYGIQDALERGPVPVAFVDGESRKIRLVSPVPPGATVYATYYYNTLVDQEYTLTVQVAGSAGVGTYTIADESGNPVLVPQFGTKSSGLSTITIQFPSGSERKPDCRFETPLSTSSYVGPVEETVTVTFKNLDSTLAKWAAPNPGPYAFIKAASDHARIQIDGSDVAGSAGHDLANHQAQAGLGFCASYLGDEIVYDPDSGGVSYPISESNNTLSVRVDGVDISGVAEVKSAGTAADYVLALNRPTRGEDGTAQGGGANTITLAASASSVDDYYVGWTVVLTNNSPAGTQGLSAVITAYDGATKVATVDSNWATAPDNSTTYRVYDGRVRPQYVAATAFDSAVEISSGVYDQVTLHYTGDNDGASGDVVATIGAGTYASPADLAAAVQAALDTALASAKWQVACTANAEGKLVFSLTKSYSDSVGYLEFVANADPARDFAVLAGIDTDSAAGKAQVKVIDGPIAKRFTVTGDQTSALLYDRIILRNRLMPGSGSLSGHHAEDQAELLISSGTGNEAAGLEANEYGVAGVSAVVKPATVLGKVGFAGGQATGYGDSRDGQPLVVFYADGGETPQNNVFKFTFDGTPITVIFKDASGADIQSGGSAEVPLGPAGVSGTVLDQIAGAMAAAGIADPVGNGYLRQEGAGIRIVSALSTEASSIVIGSGSANSVLGFTDEASYTRTLPSARQVASSLMGGINTSVASSILDWDGSITAEFAAKGLAGIVKDASNAEYLFIQSRGAAGLGTASSVAWAAAAVNDVLTYGTGLGAAVGDGAVGEAGVSGFYVTSSDPVNGSGSANDSILNPSDDGTGSDGVVGQTYRDAVTGLTFTVLPREGGGNYPDGESFTIKVSPVVATDSNLPHYGIPGVELLVTNTYGVGVGDTAVVETFERGGSQPAIGDVYYVSYTYDKTDFQTRLYTKFSAIERVYGRLDPTNPATLAAYLAMLNGAVLVGIKQVKKEDGSTQASVDAYRDAVDELEGMLPGNIGVDILVPMRGDSSDLYLYMARHADIQSSIRYRAERTVIGGFAAGTQPKDAMAIAQAVSATRVRLVYPDLVSLVLTDEANVDEEFLVDGTYLAAALAGAVVSPRRDVATPWTGTKILGFKQLQRNLSAVDQNQVAQSGITVLEDRPPVIRVRHGLTTDMSNVLTRTPTVIQIADEVQQQVRSTLERFVGIKFLPGVLSQIEGQMSNTLKMLVNAQIISAYTGVSANVSPEDPTVAEVEAAYQPVFPLLYLVVQFSLRSSL